MRENKGERERAREEEEEDGNVHGDDTARGVAVERAITCDGAFEAFSSINDAPISFSTARI